MRSIGTKVAITAAGLLLVSQLAQASEVEAELRQMQERIVELESQMGNETDSLLEEEQSGSFLSSVIENTDITGWVAASYNYNFEGHKNRVVAASRDEDVAPEDRGPTANFNPSHPDSNTFQIDQGWLEIDNQATEDSRGGVNWALETGNVNVGGGGVATYTAHASYLFPIGNGVLINGGLMPTMLGAEVNQTNANFNVTRGQVWNLQPVTNLGAVVSTEIADGISMAFGVLNDMNSAAVVDDNNEKALTGQLGWSGEDCSASFQFVWGEEEGAGDVEVGIYDVLVNYDGMEDVSMWFNYTLVSEDDGDADGEVHGIAAAARMALSDDLGVSLRGEAVLTDTDGADFETYSATLTADYGLTNHLTAKGEVRVDFSGDDVFTDKDGERSEDIAAMILAQLIYEF